MTDLQDWGLIALIGLLMGAVTFIAIPGRARGGIIPTLLVSTLTALATTWIVREIGFGPVVRFLIVVIVTALALAIWRMTRGRDATETF